MAKGRRSPPHPTQVAAPPPPPDDTPPNAPASDRGETEVGAEDEPVPEEAEGMEE